jgi:hypothetical protein
MATVNDLYGRSVQALIDHDPVDIDIYRPSKKETIGGGWKFDRSSAHAIPSIHVRLVYQPDVYPIVSTDGKIQSSSVILIAQPYEDIEVGDRFDTDDGSFEVRSISKHPSWRITAEVVQYA